MADNGQATTGMDKMLAEANNALLTLKEMHEWLELHASNQSRNCEAVHNTMTHLSNVLWKYETNQTNVQHLSSVVFLTNQVINLLK